MTEGGPFDAGFPTGPGTGRGGGRAGLRRGAGKRQQRHLRDSSPLVLAGFFAVGVALYFVPPADFQQLSLLGVIANVIAASCDIR